jgi:hypothetical protein
LRTAQIIAKRILPDWPEMSALLSDRHPAYVGGTMRHLSRIMNFKRWNSSSLNPIAHGQAEQAVRDLVQQIKRYANTDEEVVALLPMLELRQHINVSKVTGFAPWHIVHGRAPEINFGIKNQQGNDLQSETRSYPEYLKWLEDALLRIKTDVKQNTIEARTLQKQEYDKRNRVKEVDFCEGDKVYLLNKQPRNSEQIMSHKLYGTRVFIITKKVERQSTFQENDDNEFPTISETRMLPAFELTDMVTGKKLRSLIAAKRLKKVISREHFDKKHPPLIQTEALGSSIEAPNDSTLDANNRNNFSQNDSDRDKWFKAKKILNQKTQKGEISYLIKWDDNSSSWEPKGNVSEELIKQFLFQRAKVQRNRQRARRQAFQ